MIPANRIEQILITVAQAVIAAEDELNALDRAIGDGDHGNNMSRGCTELQANIADVDFGSLSEVFSYAGRTLLSSIGGASGALYGSLFMTMGRSMDDQPGYSNFVDSLAAGVDAIRELGGADINQKTMLDVIIPVLERLQSASEPDISALSEYAEQCSLHTIDMRAEKGRAAFLGDRSIGHQDPGARSSQVIISSICQAL